MAVHKGSFPEGSGPFAWVRTSGGGGAIYRAEADARRQRVEAVPARRYNINMLYRRVQLRPTFAAASGLRGKSFSSGNTFRARPSPFLLSRFV
jgi:hypothetical protein